NTEGDSTPKDEKNAAIINGKELESLITNTIVTPSEDELEDLTELFGELKKRFDENTDESKNSYTSIGGIFDDRKIVFEAHNTPLRKLVGVACNEANWGGILETSEIVLRDVVASEAEGFIPFVPDSIDTKTSFDNS